MSRDLLGNFWAAIRHSPGCQIEAHVVDHGSRGERLIGTILAKTRVTFPAGSRSNIAGARGFDLM
jgi:hypothetical protein